MISEDQLKQLAIQWFQDTGWNYTHGVDLVSDGPAPERADFRTVFLKDRLTAAVQQLNPQLPLSAVEKVVHGITTPTETSLMRKKRSFHCSITPSPKEEAFFQCSLFIALPPRIP